MSLKVGLDEGADRDDCLRICWGNVNPFAFALGCAPGGTGSIVPALYDRTVESYIGIGSRFDSYEGRTVLAVEGAKLTASISRMASRFLSIKLSAARAERNSVLPILSSLLLVTQQAILRQPAKLLTSFVNSANTALDRSVLDCDELRVPCITNPTDDRQRHIRLQELCGVHIVAGVNNVYEYGESDHLQERLGEEDTSYLRASRKFTLACSRLVLVVPARCLLWHLGTPCHFAHNNLIHRKDCQGSLGSKLDRPLFCGQNVQNSCFLGI